MVRGYGEKVMVRRWRLEGYGEKVMVRRLW